VGFLAGENLQPNRLEAEYRRLRQSSAEIVDLTCSNATAHGLLFPASILEQAAQRYFSARRYEPDAQGLLCARQAVASYYSCREPALDIRPEQVVITAGTSESYALLFSLLCDPGDDILGPQITYPLFEMFAAHARVNYRHYQSAPQEGIDGASFEQIFSPRAKAVLFVSPHNPTGCVVERASSAVQQTGIAVICDEVFADFPCRLRAVPPVSLFYTEQPVFLLNGISKMCALPDLKLGWIAMNGPACERFGERLAMLNDCFLSASTLTQSMLPEIISESRDFRAGLRAHVRENIGYALGRLAENSLIDTPLPDGGTFLFPSINAAIDEEDLAVELVRAGLYVHPGYFYGAETGVHLMISCIPKREVLSRGLDILLATLR